MIRIAQMGTGNVGVRALRRVIEHPQMELVALWVHSPDKRGKDAGELAGTDPIGILATNSLDDILAAGPDCVLYMGQETNFDDICRLLASGANVVTTRGDFHNPAYLDPAVRARVEAACAEGNSSIYSSGSSPGFISEVVTIALLAMQRRLDCLTIEESADISSRNSPEMLFEIMGYGKPVTPPETLTQLRSHSGPSLGMVAAAAGVTFDGIEVIRETAASPTDTHIAAGTIPAGTVTAIRTTTRGIHAGKPIMQLRQTFYASSDLDVDWDLAKSGWRVRVEGDTPLDVTIAFPVSDAEYANYTPNLTAHPPVNAVPYVVAAPPGICTTATLPPLVPYLGQ